MTPSIATDTFSKTALKGRVALITGCGQHDGIGAATARALHAAGASIVATDRSPPGGQDDLDRLVDEINRDGGKAIAVRTDITREGDAKAAISKAESKVGKPDILVNNAAADHGGDRLPTTDVTAEDWERVMKVNVTGMFFMCRSVLPHMKAANWGRIVSISSINAMHGQPNKAAYCASKAAVLGLTYSLASEVAKQGITVNAICPGPILTARARSAGARRGGTDPERLAQAIRERGEQVPVGRMGRPEDIAGAIVYFCSPLGEFITGQALYVDGGESI